jgi:RNA ligase
MLVEIIYPQNRVVLDYAGLDDLVLIGAVTPAGVTIPPAAAAAVSGWPGLVTKTMDAFTFAEALALPPRENAEGIVVQDVVHGHMVKIKQADYVALHKIVTGLTARKVWKHVITQRPLEEFLAPLPDEFHGWVRETAWSIEQFVALEHGRLLAAYYTVIDRMPWAVGETDTELAREERRLFAAAVAEHPDRWAMFQLLDGRDLTPELYKRAEPGPFLTPSGRTFTEETA